MSKAEILADMMVKYDAYVADHTDQAKWEAYVAAWHQWRAVKGDE